MKERILNNWSFTRFLYLAVGSFILYSSIQEMQWIGIIGGAYFAAMGIFGFGCASGACYPEQITETDSLKQPSTEDVVFEEVKSK